MAGIRNNTGRETATDPATGDPSLQIHGSVVGAVYGRRLLILLVMLAAIGIPAGVLRATCAGKSCNGNDAGQARVPFCPLPGALKADIAAGFREGRSPDVLAVTSGVPVSGGTDPADDFVPWPTVASATSTGVPIVFSGTGVSSSAKIPAGTGLDRIAPTIADAIGFDRPFPNVRAGVAVSGVASGERPRLVLEVALKGVGTQDVSDDPGAWPFLSSLRRTGAGTLDGRTGSLPLDPAATLTTIGTGGLPSQHGVTGTFIRNDDGEVVRAWSDRAAPSVIATLPDDLDQATGERSLIGLVATDPADRGLIGGNWYPNNDTDAVTIATGSGAVAATASTLANGFGRDSTTDIIAVVLERGPRADAELRQLVSTASRVAGGSLLVVVAGTGENGVNPSPTDVAGSDVIGQVEQLVPGDAPVVSATVPGGLFLDQKTLAATHLTGDAVVRALLEATGHGGQPLMADAFQGFAVSFARYC